MTTRTKTTEVPANPVTFSPEELQRVIAQATAEAVASATAALKAEMQQALADKPATTTANGKSDTSNKNSLACIKAFKAKGYGIVRPHIDVMTFNRWIAVGRRPSEKEKSLKVNGLRLFHVSQTRALTAEEKAEAQAKVDQAVDTNKAKIDAAVSPKPATKGKAKGKGAKVIPMQSPSQSPSA